MIFSRTSAGTARTWGNSVHSNAFRRTFLRQRFGESVDTGLRGGVVDLSVLPGLAID